MFDITSSKLLILGLVALIVIGPKDLPALLRTIGKYMGIIKRHANDFRAQFEDAMRESELQQIKAQVDTMTKDAEASMREAESTIQKQMADAQAGVDPNVALGDPFSDAKPAPDVVIASPDAAAAELAPSVAGSVAGSVISAPEPPPAPPVTPQTADAHRAPEKSGA